MKKTKISIVVSDLSESGVGRWAGGSVRPFLLGRALQKLDYEVTIVGFIFGEISQAIQSDEMKITAVKGELYPRFFQSAAQLWKKIDGDIIYAYKPKPSSFGLSLLKKWVSHRPLILDIDDWELSWYGGDDWKYQPSFKQLYRDLLKENGCLRHPDFPLYLKWMEQWVSQADLITTHTQFLRQRFGGIYLPNGKDVNLFNPQNYDPQVSRRHYGLSEYRILMFPGAPRPYKGLEDILMALDILNQSDLRLVIVGGSPYDDYDEKLVQKWGRWMIKLPKIPYLKMPEVIAAADIIVVPQRNTPAAQAQFPLKLTDGMAMAKPILATHVGDIPEILAETGYLVNPNSPEQLAEKIQWIFENLAAAHQKGIAARNRCCEFYSLETMVNILSERVSGLFRNKAAGMT